MTENNQPQESIIKDWVFRIKKPSQEGGQPKIMLLLHGHLGNEKSMWILTNRLSNSYTFIAPRAPVKTGENQYSWHEISKQWPSLDHYENLAEQLLDRVTVWCNNNDVKFGSFDVMGFSQGAVMAYALAFLYPEKIGKIAALASFIPQSWKAEIDPLPFKNKSFFIAHGTEDQIIPIEKASKAATWLKEQGANVTFCKADIGHKLSADCFKGLGEFFN